MLVTCVRGFRRNIALVHDSVEPRRNHSDAADPIRLLAVELSVDGVRFRQHLTHTRTHTLSREHATRHTLGRSHLRTSRSFEALAYPR